MSLLILALCESTNIESVLACPLGDEFTTLIAWATSQGIQFVNHQVDAIAVGTYVTPISVPNAYLYFQALSTGVGSDVFYTSVGRLVYVVQNP